MNHMISSYNELIQSPEDCEIVADEEMVRMIERGKDGLDDYFGGPEDDEDEDEKEHIEVLFQVVLYAQLYRDHESVHQLAAHRP